MRNVSDIVIKILWWLFIPGFINFILLWGIKYGCTDFPRNLDLIRNGNHTYGTIVGHNVTWKHDRKSPTQKKSSDAKMYNPIISYKDQYGNNHKMRTDYSRGFPEQSNSVNIYYDPSSPKKVISGGYFKLLFLPIIIIIICLLAIWGEFLILRYFYRDYLRKKRNNINSNVHYN